jgi:hypothetical protein
VATRLNRKLRDHHEEHEGEDKVVNKIVFKLRELRALRG